MFNELVESSVAKKKTEKGWAVTLSIFVQCLILGVLILLPLLYTQALPHMLMNMVLTEPAPSAPAGPPSAASVRATRPVARFMSEGVLRAPRAIPSAIEIFAEPALPPEPPGSNGDGFESANTLGNALGSIGSGSNVPAPPPPPKPAQNRVKLGGQVAEARLTSRVQPIYPVLARQAGITGVVVLHAIIAKDGSVSQLEIVSGHPLLVQAALDAVRQWRYQPEVLNGDPVEVDTTITVNFQLGR
jgi:periplasmic protein TonB